MKKLIIFMLLPMLSFAQFPLEEEYLFAKLEIDPKNAIYGSDKNEPGLNFIASIGYRAEGGTQMQFAYESFELIKYQASYFEFGHYWNSEKRFQQGIMAGAGFIFRDVSWAKAMSCTLSISGNLEYHLTNWLATTARMEARYRGDLKKVIPSGYVGFVIKAF